MAARARVWRAPAGQPAWSRPLLLAIAALAALSYCWGIGNQEPEIYYAAAVRSMSMSWHNLFFAAFDPGATISIDKLPGALWLQVLSVKLLGLHLWTLNLPQAIEGTLTVLVLYRAVRRLAGPLAAIVAAAVAASTPATVALNRGNISDTLLILLLVCAVDAASAAVVTGSTGSLLLAGLWVGLAFQAKMVQAWLILPALLLAWLVAAPIAPRRRERVAAGMLGLAAIVSLSWMLVVSAVPHGDRPYVDGSHDDSLFAQVFEYNALSRADSSQVAAGSPVAELRSALTLDSVGRVDRTLAGPGGRAIGWLLPVAVAGLLAGGLRSRRRARGDPLRAACLLWGAWLAIDVAAFTAAAAINPYYLAALTPPIAALTGIAVATGWEQLGSDRALPVRVAVAALAAASAGYGLWLAAPAPVWLRLVLVLGAAVLCLLAAASRRAVAAALAAILLAPALASAAVVAEGGGPFNTPFQPRVTRDVSQAGVAGSIAVARTAMVLLSGNQGSDRYAAATYTSLLAAPLIYVGGADILPVGGFTGRTPSPTLARLIADVKQGAVSTVIVVPSRDARVRWVEAHCSKVFTRDSEIVRTFYCA